MPRSAALVSAAIECPPALSARGLRGLFTRDSLRISAVVLLLRARSWVVSLGMVPCAALTIGCGGGAAKSEPSSEHIASSDTRARHAESSASSEDEASEDAAPEAPCTDGTCFSCGKGYCPSGWYCDESAAGGAACAWLPACNGKNQCRCLEQTLGAECSCSDADSAARVTCK
ncbi:MAG TPA: hypothetical protein VFQ61_36205 [Polyangiaceae bacterium]|nr:hypothetical protein [Polyangiaceae bacterium]